MAVVAGRAQRGTKCRLSSEYCLELGILNNMPDAALARTEQQFFTLLAAAADNLLVRVHFFSLATMTRDRLGHKHLGRHAYTPAAEISDSNLDALIITGTEPRAPDLRQEPYWSELNSVFDWVSHEGPSTVFSCLAAHAAVLRYDGIERQRLAEKCVGLFEHVASRDDRLTQSLSSPLHIAHSRWNDLCENDLAACGYHVLTSSREAGVELFVKRGRNDLLFCQGHPEYDAMTLAREYRRDVKRWLKGETDTYPLLPKNYFSAAERLALDQFRARAAFERSEALITDFPPLAQKRNSEWNAPGMAIFSAWLRTIVDKKRTQSSVPVHTACAAPRFRTEAA